MSEIDNLKERARQIKNADTPKENTAYRVGSLLEDTIDYMGDIDVVNVDNHLSSTSTNPVQNKIITNALEEKIDGSELNNYYRKNEVDSRLSSKANTADLSSVATTGNYNDLSNKPTIPVVPSNVSAFNNDAGYLKQQDISGKADKNDLATVAMSGNYNDLIETPECITQQGLESYTYDKNTIDEKVAQGGQFDPTQYYTKNQTDSAINTAVNDMATMTWVGDQNYLTEHQSLDTLFDGAEYDINSKRINFKHGNTILAYIDATQFIKDGMVSNVEVKNVMIDGNLVLCLVITFNTESGQEPINIPIASIFDVDNFYTKDETDVLLQNKQNTLTPGTGITIENNTISITGGGVGNVSDVFYDNNNKKIYKTVDGNTDDVVTAAQLKSDMALDNVENKSSETIRGEITKNNVTTALGYTPPETDTTYEEATLSEAGLMSSSDKDKLDNIAANATKVEASETNGNIKIDGTETTVYTHQAPSSAEIVEALGYTPPQQDTNTTYQFQQDGNTLKMGTDGGTKNAIYTPSLSKVDVGLDNVDNTHDADKSVAFAENAGDATTVGGHTVASDVPSNAVFTDTTYSAGTGISILDNVISAAVYGVKGFAESTYRTGNVDITPANILTKTTTNDGYGHIYDAADSVLTTAAFFTQTNTVYHIRYNHTLTANLIMPENCVLQFDGGRISANGQYNTIKGQNTKISAGLVKIFSEDITLTGEHKRVDDNGMYCVTAWNIPYLYPEWWGAVGDSTTDDIIPINKCISVGLSIQVSTFLSKTYYITSPIIFNHPELWPNRPEYYDIMGNGQCKIIGAQGTHIFDSTLDQDPDPGKQYPVSQYLRVSKVVFPRQKNFMFINNKIMRVTFDSCHISCPMLRVENNYVQEFRLHNCLINYIYPTAFIGSTEVVVRAFLDISHGCPHLEVNGCSYENCFCSFLYAKRVTSGYGYVLFYISNSIFEGIQFDGSYPKPAFSLERCNLGVISHCYFESCNGGFIVAADSEGTKGLSLIGNNFSPMTYPGVSWCYPCQDNTGGHGAYKVVWWGSDGTVSIGNRGLGVDNGPEDTEGYNGHFFRGGANKNMYIHDFGFKYNNDAFVSLLPEATDESRMKGVRDGLRVIDRDDFYKQKICMPIGGFNDISLDKIITLVYNGNTTISGTLNGVSYTSTFDTNDTEKRSYVLFNGNPFSAGDTILVDMAPEDASFASIAYSSDYSWTTHDKFYRKFSDFTTFTVPENSSNWYFKIEIHKNNVLFNGRIILYKKHGV